MKKYLFLILLTISFAYSQDTLKLKPKKNHFGISISPGIIAFFNPSSNSQLSYLPLFTTSFYLEYNRILSKRIWLTGGIGTFTSGYNFSASKYSGISLLGGDSMDSKVDYTHYDNNFSLHLKPKFIVVDKKILLYAGLSTQMNFYLTSVSIVNEYYKSNETHNTQSISHNLNRNNSVYGGIVSGIGYNHKRFLFVLEPEFKVSITSMLDFDGSSKYSYYSNNYAYLIPYSLVINVLAYYKF